MNHKCSRCDELHPGNELHLVIIGSVSTILCDDCYADWCESEALKNVF